jgi:hypothetical protein
MSGTEEKQYSPKNFKNFHEVMPSRGNGKIIKEISKLLVSFAAGCCSLQCFIDTIITKAVNILRQISKKNYIFLMLYIYKFMSKL